MGVEATIRIGTPKGDPPPRVLELRVHGVNNTTPAALLDLPAESVRLAAGDKLGAFWRPTDDVADLPADSRGHVPPGFVREAYSWGGMVRTTPNFGGAGFGGTVLAVLARVAYAVILPFSIGNAVQWTRSLTQPGDSDARRIGNAITAGLARGFGLILTLLFATTAAALSLDIGASQCAADPTLCGPIASAVSPFADWTSGQRLALFSLGPVIAIALLWIVSAVSRVRYDVLPGMETHSDAALTGTVDTTLRAPLATLSQPGFWSNRITRHLARGHLAAAILLTTAFTAAQASTLEGAPEWLRVGALGMIWIAAFSVFAAALLVCLLPTMTIDTEERLGRLRTAWERSSLWLLIVAMVLFAVTAGTLALAPTADGAPTHVAVLDGAALVVVAVGALIALSGLFWRPRRARRDVAWWGCGPAVFMSLSLALAAATSSIVIVTIGDWLNGSKGPAALVGWSEAAPEGSDASLEVTWGDITRWTEGSVTFTGASEATLGLQVSAAFVALGTAVLFGVVAALLVIASAQIPRRDVTPRVALWTTDTSAENLQVPTGGVLPPSRATLFARILAKRTIAARMHTAEPAAGVAALALGIAVLAGIWWTVTTLPFAPGGPLPLWAAFGQGAERVVVDILGIVMPALALVGLALVAALAAGATGGGSRPLGIVWDIACFLPRTGHPFGPPCYAERAVPEIAGRLNAWLTDPEGRDRRAVLSAHSMGAVLSVAAIGLLASSPSTQLLLPRIALLTFGVQLRPFFGRMLPELLGPRVLGTHSSRAPSLAAADPWAKDVAVETRRRRVPSPPSSPLDPPIGMLGGSLVRGDRRPTEPEFGDVRTGTALRWVSLFRFTDYLGYPAFSTAKKGLGWTNDIDRCVAELDRSGYMVEVGTHGEYYRTPDYTQALQQLRADLR